MIAGEIAFERLSEGRRRRDLQEWFDDLLRTVFDGRVLPFGQAEALWYGRLAARLGRKEPNSLQVQDVQIAATAACHVVTRNLRDFAELGVSLVDPWSAT